MKKTYIEPKTRLVAADVCDDMMISGSTGGQNIVEDGGNASQHGIDINNIDGRETISAPDAWEEW